MTDSTSGSKRMFLGVRLAGKRMVDAMGKRNETVVIDADGWGTFNVDEGSVSVWVTEDAQEALFVRLPSGA